MDKFLGKAMRRHEEIRIARRDKGIANVAEGQHVGV